MSAKTLFLHVLIAFLFFVSTTALALDDAERGQSIASAIADGIEGGPSPATVATAPSTEHKPKPNSTSASAPRMSASGNSRKKSKAEKARQRASALAATSPPRRPPIPSAMAVGAMAAVVPLIAFFITMTMVVFRFYLDKIEEEEEDVRREKNPHVLEEANEAYNYSGLPEKDRYPKVS
ncbi:hypothetical protein CC80DRAFT_25625 [Byssothecium circinans]|uniref:Transmembrane protein n=1 Tax=Byssothecium circinans TaxID=147558 RepID=A0A6A5TZW0_9PLEO|nr:hypothetical protein CC80DRAFT_25625 [Byssothecium circinans]